MIATYVPDKVTPVAFPVALAAMDAALTSAGITPSVPTRALAMAKTTLEAGRDVNAGLVWTSSHRSNIGNVKAGEKYDGQFTAFACNEVLDGKVVWFSPFGRLSGRGGVVVGDVSANPPGHPQCRFRAFANEIDGAYEYVKFIAGGRYVDAWEELKRGDAAGYVEALHRKGYFTADPEVYARGVILLQKEYIAKIKGLPHSAVDYLPSVEVVQSMLAPQRFNAEQVLAWQATEDAAFEALNESKNAQLHGDDE